MKVLIVDDEPAIRSSIRRTLVREYGADVDGVGTGYDALARLLQHTYDLVLLDIRMPEMDGLQTLQAIRRSQNRHSIPVVMLTGDSDANSVREAMSLGVSEYLLKPVQPDALVRRLAEVLARPAKDKAGSSGAAGDNPVLTIRQRDHLLLIEPSPVIAAFVAGQLQNRCEVISEPSSTVALTACLAAPPAVVLLGGDDATANALFLARIRNDAKTRSVPVYALVAREHMAHARDQLAFDGVLPRTVEASEWNAAVARTFRFQGSGEHYLEAAHEGVRQFLGAMVSEPVLKLDDPGPARLRRWLSSRIVFTAGGATWQLTQYITYPSVTRLASLTASIEQGVTDSDIAAVLEGFGSTVAAALAKVSDGEPRASIGATATCTGVPPQAEAGAAPGAPVRAAEDQWLKVPGHDILVCHRIMQLPAAAAA